MLKVLVERIADTAAVGTARSHHILTDRPSSSGGRDLGPTSGELMLLAVGSCIVGTSRTCIDKLALSVERIRADVCVRNCEGTNEFGTIGVVLDIGGNISKEARVEIMKAANSGRVTSRLRKASGVVINWAEY